MLEGLSSTVHIKTFSGAVAGEEDHFCKGSLSLSIFLFCYCFWFLILFAALYQKSKNISLLFIFVIVVSCFTFVKWLLLKIPSCVTLLAPTIVILFAHLLLHLLLKGPFMKLILPC